MYRHDDEEVTAALRAGASPNTYMGWAGNEGSIPALLVAAYWGHSSIVKILLIADVSVIAKDSSGKSQLHRPNHQRYANPC